MWSFTMGGVRDDLHAMRTDIHDLRHAGGQTSNKLGSTTVALDKEISDLTAQLKITNARLADLNAGVKSVDEKLSKSIEAQNSFEKWVVARLGAVAPNVASLPAGWLKSQDVIIQKITSEGDPLATWYQGSLQKN